jgi:hypothetical protein
MNRLAMLAVPLTLVLLGAAPAAAQLTPIFPNQQQQRAPDPDAQRKKDAAVSTCVGTVKKERPASKFDAYSANGQVRVYGNPDESRAFDQCMQQQGQRTR